LNALQVHITQGPQAGTRLQVSQSPVTFGRSPDNTLVLDLPLVSRNHGELHFVDGQWVLHNLSQNGTRIDRKRVTKKPRELTDGASIIIGDEEIFRVYLTNQAIDDGNPTPAAVPEGDDPQQPTHIPGSGLKGRSRLWLFASIWFGAMICVFALLFTFFGGKDDTDPEPTNAIVFYENPDEILDLLKVMPPRMEHIPSKYDGNIDSARAAYESNPRDNYGCYEHYRIAMLHMPDAQDYLIGEDMNRYTEVARDLSVLIDEYYGRAYVLWKSGQNVEAVRHLDELRRLFAQTPGPNAPVATAIIRLRQRAAGGIDR